MIAPLTEQEWQTNEAIARRVNVVIEAVEALRRQFERHEAAEDGAEPVGGWQAADGEGQDEAPLALDAIEQRAHRLAGSVYAHECYNDQLQDLAHIDIPALIAEAKRLRAERDAAQARVAALESDAAKWAMVERLCERKPHQMWEKHPCGDWIVWYDGQGYMGATIADALRAALGEQEAGE